MDLSDSELKATREMFKKEKEEQYKLCYVKNNKAWFTSNFEKQWGDDWGDIPYEYNAGEPYDHWDEEIPHKYPVITKEYKEHKIEHKIVFFDLSYYDFKLPYDGFNNSPFSVRDINNKAIAWIRGNDFNILAGTTYKEFCEIIESHGGKIYEERHR